MRRPLLVWSTVAAACLLSSAGKALAEPMGSMCDAPKMKTDKWQQRSENGGMTILIPPGFSAGGMGYGSEESGAHYYHNGEHRLLIIGFGAGLMSMMRNRNVTEDSECETVLAGRRALITIYSWVNEGDRLTAAGGFGAHSAAVARFYAAGVQPELFVAFITNAKYELNSFKQVFWTVSFGASPAATVAASPFAAPTVASTAVTTVASTQPVVVAPAACTAESTAGLPTANTVIDSSVVQTLLASAAPIPNGYEVMQLQFDGSGELAGMSVAQSDLPEASQRELAAVVGTNLKPHDAKAPASILLRIDSVAAGLRYTVLPASACAQ